MPPKYFRLWQIWLVLACGLNLPPAIASDVPATYSEGLLAIPALLTATETYRLELVLSNTAPIEFTLQDALTREHATASILDATFSENRLHIPCLQVGDNYYQAEMQLLRQEPDVVFDEVTATEIGRCAYPQPGQLTFMSPHANPIVVNSDLIYSVNTPADTVDILDSSSSEIVARINVGVDPVGLAVKPDGMEVWVANHVSDSISVIDSDPASPSFHQVIATIQDLNQQTGATNFDEPVGIAFASNDKAYVALSSTDRIAIVDATQYRVAGHRGINAQDPRAITVRDGRLYVIAFESNNQTELSGCFGVIDGDQCTFSLQEHVVDNNNVLSLNYDADIVRDPRVPDRDLFVFDTGTDELISTVSSIGTLLYGITVDSQGTVFIAQTDARNATNGRAGTQKQTLADLDNRAFLNQIATVKCQSSTCGQASRIELEPLPPALPAADMTFATPFAIEVSADDDLLFVTAASSNKLFTMDASTGAVLGQLEVGSAPRGVALQADDTGAPATAWVLNAVDNTVSKIDVSQAAQPQLLDTIALDDPTDAELKRGRALFNSAKASSTGTFSCESCHPDGHTDQLLWVLGGPRCEISGCNQIPPRSTMPIRGLRSTAPYHWDGVPGDPFGRGNGQFPFGDIAPNCSLEEPESCTRNLVDGALASTMCDQSNCPNNEENKAGLLSAEERDAMAKFLLSVPHPPARERAFTDELSAAAREGFDDFFVKDPPPGSVSPTCGTSGCHAMPFWTGTNASGSGMDAPSFRSLQDRWLLLPQGRVNMYEIVAPVLGEKGFDEFTMWTQMISGTTEAEWQMFNEGSMGYPGAFARQLTLNQLTASAEGLSESEALLQAIELAAGEDTLLLQGEGIQFENGVSSELALHYEGGVYEDKISGEAYSREQLFGLAAEGNLLLTLTGRLPENVDYAHPQPEIWSPQLPAENVKIAFPRLFDNSPMRMLARHIGDNPAVFVDGRRVSSEVTCESGQWPQCTGSVILVQLEHLPTSPGMHLLQLQSQNGLLSNEYLFFVF